MTNRPFFDWKVATKLKKVEDGYDIVYRTETIYIYGMPEIMTLSQRDIIAYTSALTEGEGKTAESEVEAVIRRLNG